MSWAQNTGRSHYGRRRRAQKRERMERIRTIGMHLLMVAVLVVVALGVPYLVFNGYLGVVSSDYFKLKNVELYGNRYLDDETILARGEIVEGTNIFDIDKQAIEEALISDPWIASVNVETHLPDSLDVTVTEYQPVAVLVTGTQWRLIDPSGYPFKVFEPTDPAETLLKLPFITGPTVEELNTEDVRQLVVSAIQLYDIYSQSQLAKKDPLSEIHVDSVVGLSLVLDSGIRVQVGADRFPERLLRLSAILDTLKKDRLHPDYILIDQEDQIDKVTVGNYPQS